MNWAASNQAEREELQNPIQGKRFYKQKGAGTTKLCEAEKQTGCRRIPPFWDGRCPSGRLPTNADPTIPDSLV